LQLELTGTLPSHGLHDVVTLVWLGSHVMSLMQLHCLKNALLSTIMSIKFKAINQTIAEECKETTIL